MPRSILLGRPLPAPGEPLFLPADTAAVMALAEEESDTCPACGMPKAWCRAQSKESAEAALGRFEVHEERCLASYVLALRREKHDGEGMHAATRQALQSAVRFRKGREPSLMAGLGIDDEDEGGGARG